jgi:hypothetical protein
MMAMSTEEGKLDMAPGFYHIDGGSSMSPPGLFGDPRHRPIRKCPARGRALLLIRH